MVLKVNLLTKRLVERNSILAEQAGDLKFKQEIYTQIRDSLKKCPGLEAPENVRYYRHLQKAKVKQLEGLKFELRAAESQAEYYQEEIIRLQDRLKKTKEKYFERQKRMKKKICHNYFPLPMEMEECQEENRENQLEAISSGLEWSGSIMDQLTPPASPAKTDDSHTSSLKSPIPTAEDTKPRDSRPSMSLVKKSKEKVRSSRTSNFILK